MRKRKWIWMGEGEGTGRNRWREHIMRICYVKEISSIKRKKGASKHTKSK